MRAVILAAGKGSRLGVNLNGKPKCLLEVGGRSLLEHQLQSLRALEISDICIVVGYHKEMIHDQVGDSCTLVANTLYRGTNSLYSLWLAREWIQGSFMLMNSDVIAHPDIYREIYQYPGSVLAYDSTSGGDDEHMKVVFENHCLTKIRKSLSEHEATGENLGIMKFDDLASKRLMVEADAMITAGEVQCWGPAAVDRICHQVPIHGIDASDKPWAEIDFPDDLAFARRCPSFAPQEYPAKTG